jgi:hypothetical protein
MSQQTASGSDDWRGNEVVHRLRWLHSFVRAAIDRTEKRLDALEDKYQSETDDRAKKAWERLWRDAREWLDKAKTVRAHLIEFARDASVKIKKITENPHNVDIRDEIRGLLQELNDTIEDIRMDCLEAVGRGTFEEIEALAEGVDVDEETDEESETEAESEEIEEFRELQDEITNLRDSIDTTDERDEDDIRFE